MVNVNDGRQLANSQLGELLTPIAISYIGGFIEGPHAKEDRRLFFLHQNKRKMGIPYAAARDNWVTLRRRSFIIIQY